MRLLKLSVFILVVTFGVIAFLNIVDKYHSSKTEVVSPTETPHVVQEVISEDAMNEVLDQDGKIEEDQYFTPPPPLTDWKPPEASVPVITKIIEPANSDTVIQRLKEEISIPEIATIPPDMDPGLADIELTEIKREINSLLVETRRMLKQQK